VRKNRNGINEGNKTYKNSVEKKMEKIQGRVKRRREDRSAYKKIVKDSERTKKGTKKRK
jgi:hypothetical protein